MAAVANIRDALASRSMFAGQEPKRAAPKRDFDPDRALQEIADAESERMNHEALWRSAFNLTMPDRQGFDSQAPGQQRIPQETFDAYPIGSCQRGIGNIIGALCPPGQAWSELAAGSAVPKGEQEKLAKGTERVTEVVFDYLDQSTFSTELHAGCSDLMVSTLFLTIDIGNKERPFKVKSHSLTECFPVEGPYGDIENVYRRYACRPEHIKRNWPGAKISQRIQRMIDGKSREKVTVIEATTFEEGRGFRFTVFDPADKSIIYDVPPSDPLAPSRWIVARFGVRPGDVYGYGPAIIGLATIRTLNKTRELSLKARAKAVAPPTLFDTRTGLNPHTIRLGANYVGMYNGANLGGAQPFVEMPAAVQAIAIANEEMRDDRQIIDDILFADQVVPAVQESHGMTAYEVQVRRQMLLQQRGVNLGRLQRELPDSVMRRCVYVLGQLGLVPELRVDGRIFMVKPLGPIAQAQRADDANSTLAFISQLRAAIGDEAATLAVKMEDVGANVGKTWPGVDNSLLRDEQEREVMQKQAAQIMAMQAAGQGPGMDTSNLPGVPA